MEEINPQSLAVRIEHIVCRVFNCERGGENGIGDSDYIRRKPFFAMMYTICRVFAYDYRKQEAVENFFDEYCACGKQSIDELLQTNCATAISMIDDFSSICS